MYKITLIIALLLLCSCSQTYKLKTQLKKEINSMPLAPPGKTDIVERKKLLETLGDSVVSNDTIIVIEHSGFFSYNATVYTSRDNAINAYERNIVRYNPRTIEIIKTEVANWEKNLIWTVQRNTLDRFLKYNTELNRQTASPMLYNILIVRKVNNRFVFEYYQK